MSVFKSALALALGMLASQCRSDTIHVPQDFPTIGIAILEADPLDTIIVAPGEYFEAINFSGKIIRIQSENPNDPQIVANTVIDAGGLGTVVTFSGTKDELNSGLYGFTIQGGTNGIDGHGSTAAIHHCVIRYNSGIGINNADGHIYGCDVRNNGTQGMVSCDGEMQNSKVRNNGSHGLHTCGATIVDSTISDNGEFGLDYCQGATLRSTVVSGNRGANLNTSDVTIEACLIYGARQTPGLGYGLTHCGGSIRNSVIAGNNWSGLQGCSSAVLSCTITGNGAYGIEGHSGLISHTILWDNALGAINQSNTPAFSSTTNPFFVQPGYRDHAHGGVWVQGDYHLSSDSPFINAGDPFYAENQSNPMVDLDGNPRVAGVRVDLGAYEFQGTDCDGADFDGDATADACDRDIDNDGVTNVPDVCDYTSPGVPVSSDGRPLADLDHDCDVDLHDHALMQSSFGGPE